MSKNLLFSKDILNFYQEPSGMTHFGVTIKNKTKTVPALDELTNDKEKEKQKAMKQKSAGPCEYTGRTPNLQQGRGTSGKPCDT